MAEGMNQPAAGMIPSFKGQPWILWDTIASTDFTVGSATNALGSDGPAIGGDGRMIFFNGARNKAKNPNLTNMDVNGQMSYGFNCWAVGIEIALPALPAYASIVQGATTDVATAPTRRLAEAIMNFGTLTLDLGQEEQTAFPCTSFGSGGGLYEDNSVSSAAQNGPPDIRAVMTLPQPVAMGRTQNINAVLNVAQFMFALIGTVGALGVGQPLGNYILITAAGDPPTTISRPQPPYAIKLKLIGERVKLTQYGAPNV